MKILVAEDDPAVARLIEYMAGREGHEVEIVSTYSAVVTTEMNYDAAVVDLTLGDDRDAGVSVARLLHNRGVKVIVIVTGADDERIEEVKLILKGVAGVVVKKPFTVQEVLEALGMKRKEESRSEGHS